MFLAKLKCSLALDRNRGQVAQEHDLGNAFASLDRRLRKSRTRQAAPPDLHTSIMRSVRHASRGRREAFQPWLRHWATAAGAVSLLVFGAWLVMTRSLPTSTNIASHVEVQPMIAVALNEGCELTQKAPNAALAPLFEEFKLLNRDFQSAANLLVATMP